KTSGFSNWIRAYRSSFCSGKEWTYGWLSRSPDLRGTYAVCAFPPFARQWLLADGNSIAYSCGAVTDFHRASRTLNQRLCFEYTFSIGRLRPRDDCCFRTDSKQSRFAYTLPMKGRMGRKNHGCIQKYSSES